MKYKFTDIVFQISEYFSIPTILMSKEILIYFRRFSLLKNITFVADALIRHHNKDNNSDKNVYNKNP